MCPGVRPFASKLALRDDHAMVIDIDIADVEPRADAIGLDGGIVLCEVGLELLKEASRTVGRVALRVHHAHLP